MANSHVRPGGRPAPPQGGDRELPAPQTVTYFTQSEDLSADLLDSQAESWAKKLKKVAPSQLRRFYDHVLTLERRLQLESSLPGADRERAFERMRADFRMLKAKAAYANGRNAKQFPDEFLQFFINHTHAVKTARDFEAFVKHFQAVVAFHKYHAEEKES